MAEALTYFTRCAGVVQADGVPVRIRGGKVARTGLGTYDLTLDQAVAFTELVLDVVPIAGGLQPQILQASDTVKQIVFQDAATKMQIYPADTLSNMDDLRTRQIAGPGNFNFNFCVPSDFGSLVSLVALGIPSVGAAGPARVFDLSSTYGVAPDSAFDSIVESGSIQLDLTGRADIWTNIDLSSVVTQLAADVFGGVNINHQAIGGAIDYVELRLFYLAAAVDTAFSFAANQFTYGETAA